MRDAAGLGDPLAARDTARSGLCRATSAPADPGAETPPPPSPPLAASSSARASASLRGCLASSSSISCPSLGETRRLGSGDSADEMFGRTGERLSRSGDRCALSERLVLALRDAPPAPAPAPPPPGSSAGDTFCRDASSADRVLCRNVAESPEDVARTCAEAQRAELSADGDRGRCCASLAESAKRSAGAASSAGRWRSTDAEAEAEKDGDDDDDDDDDEDAKTPLKRRRVRTGSKRCGKRPVASFRAGRVRPGSTRVADAGESPTGASVPARDSGLRAVWFLVCADPPPTAPIDRPAKHGVQSNNARERTSQVICAFA